MNKLCQSNPFMLTFKLLFPFFQCVMSDKFHLIRLSTQSHELCSLYFTQDKIN